MNKEEKELIDVAVIGYGFAGGMSAITAAQKGRHVVIFEKMSIPGGISICSGGGFRVATDQKKAYSYLLETNQNSIDLNLLDQFSNEMVKLPEVLKKIGRAHV